MAIQVHQLDHITLVVKDLAATRRFYVEVLGMEEVPRPAFNFVGQWFRAGSTLVHTILEYDGSGPAGEGASRNSRGHHFAFRISNPEAAIQHLAAMNVVVIVPPKLRPDGAFQMFIHDPDGHLVELSCERVNGAV